MHHKFWIFIPSMHGSWFDIPWPIGNIEHSYFTNIFNVHEIIHWICIKVLLKNHIKCHFFSIFYFIDNSIKNILHSNQQICSVYGQTLVVESITFFLVSWIFVHSNPRCKKKRTWKKIITYLYVISPKLISWLKWNHENVNLMMLSKMWILIKKYIYIQNAMW